MTLWRDQQRVTIEVADGNPDLPTALPPSSLSATSGRGLVIVDGVSADWGVAPSTAGKVVWAEVDCVAAAPVTVHE